ncbi:hypothetical protein SOVF_097680, partial [Spinacia oleracea]
MRHCISKWPPVNCLQF